MSAPVDQIRIPTLPTRDSKARVEEDAKRVAVNPQAATLASDLGKTLDTIHPQANAALETVKSETRTILSTVVGASKTFYRQLFPEKSVEANALPKGLSKPDVQPTIRQKPSIERPTASAEHSMTKLVKASSESPVDNEEIASAGLIARGGGGGAPPTEALLMKAIFAAMGRQSKLREENTKTNQILIQDKGEKQKKLIEEYMAFKEMADNKQETASILSWTGFGAGLLGGVLALGGIIATVATGGAAIPLVLGVGAGIAGVASGGSQIASTVLNYQSEKDQARAFEVKQEKDLIANSMSVMLQDMESNDNSIAAVWAKIAQVLRNKPDFFR